MGNKNNIFQELWYRLKMPWTISFTLYFLFVIIIFGGLGVILSLIYCTDNLKLNISSNLMTYSIALLVPACITILLQYFPKAQNRVSLVILSVAVLVKLATSKITFSASLNVFVIDISLAKRK